MKTRWPSFLGLVLGFSLLAGCDTATPVERCDSFEVLVCMRAVECKTQDTQDQCLTDARKDVMCGQAKTVGSTYDACMSELRAATCDALMASGLPDSCFSAILF